MSLARAGLRAGLRLLLLAVSILAAGQACRLGGERPLVVFLGDSLTSGWRLPQEEAYPALVARALAERGQPIRAVNAGRNGDTVAQARARLQSALRQRPQVLVVALGTNDALRGLPLQDAEAALDAIVSAAHASGARVLLLGIGRVGWLAPDRVRAVRDLHARIAVARRVPLLPDLLDGVAGRPELLFPDMLHPNAAGQQRLAQKVRPQLELLLAELTPPRPKLR